MLHSPSEGLLASSRLGCMLSFDLSVVMFEVLMSRMDLTWSMASGCAERDFDILELGSVPAMHLAM
jgi:hypothetical protein